MRGWHNILRRERDERSTQINAIRLHDGVRGRDSFSWAVKGEWWWSLVGLGDDGHREERGDTHASSHERWRSLFICTRAHKQMGVSPWTHLNLDKFCFTKIIEYQPITSITYRTRIAHEVCRRVRYYAYIDSSGRSLLELIVMSLTT